MGNCLNKCQRKKTLNKRIDRKREKEMKEEFQIVYEKYLKSKEFLL